MDGLQILTNIVNGGVGYAREEIEMERKEWVEKLNFVENELTNLIKKAKPNLVSCELITTGNDDIVIITCENGYCYRVNVTCNSLIAIASDVINAVMFK